METLSIVRRRPAVIAAVLSAIPSLIGNRSGIGLSWDSTDYIAVGRSIAAGRGALDVTGAPMVIRPPGLSSLVAIGEWSALSPDITLRLVNAVSMAIIVWCTHLGAAEVEHGDLGAGAADRGGEHDAGLGVQHQAAGRAAAGGGELGTQQGLMAGQAGDALTIGANAVLM